MNKTKKGFLSASAIITIVAASFGILTGIVTMFMGGLMTEETIRDTYTTEEGYTLVEEYGKDYYITYIDDGELIKVTEDEIELIANISSSLCNFVGIIIIGFSLAKLILAIKILINNNRDKYGKGVTIALLTLSVLNMNLLEAGLIITAMCMKDDVNSEKPDENNNIETKDDVVLEEISKE